MANYATRGVKLYFLGYFFAGLNIVLVGFLSATARAKEAFIASILRGLIAIIFFAYILAYFFGFTGVWLSFMAAEAFTLVVVLYFIVRYMKKKAV
jgi:Na+-driven multidrug efflux pump